MYFIKRPIPQFKKEKILTSNCINSRRKKLSIWKNIRDFLQIFKNWKNKMKVNNNKKQLSLPKKQLKTVLFLKKDSIKEVTLSQVNMVR